MIAFRGGSAPEVINGGETGFIVDTIEDAVKAVGRAGTLSRLRCREVFQKRFSAARMAREYVPLYQRIPTFTENQAA